MGLDMYFISVPKGEDPEASNARHTIKYFRKHSDLHGWLEERWLESHPEKNGFDFNCVFMQITPEILEGIKKLCTSPELREKYCGFFWGASEEDDWAETFSMCLSPEMYDKQTDVYYYSWW